MKLAAGSPAKSGPQAWRDFEGWMRESLGLSEELQAELLSAIDTLFSRHERLWQVSKQETMNALASTFADRIAQAKTEISARDRRIADISRHFDGLVAQLTEKASRDPKTKLMNLAHFTERLEAFLAFEQRGRWCVVGMVDIADFKQYNDTLGHVVGDQIIDTVARLLRECVRGEDLLARESPEIPQQLHGRFGGDEFCFMLSTLSNCHQGYAIADRFRDAVARYDWTSVDTRLGSRPIRVDVGVVCFKLGRITDRRAAAQPLAARLLERADELMYTAKAAESPGAAWMRVQFENGELIDVPENETTPAQTANLSTPEHHAL
jgi:diguanylate cyclase (GGDEF)-like protein